MGRLINSTKLHSAIQANDIDSVKIFSKTELINVGCVYEINSISSYNYCTPLHLAILQKRVKIANILIEQSDIDVNVAVQLIQKQEKYISFTLFSTLAIAMQLGEVDIIDVLLSHPKIIVSITDLKSSIALLSQQHDDKYLSLAIDIIRKCEKQFLKTCKGKYEARKTEQKHVYSALFRGVPRSAKLAATNFLLDNLDHVLTLKKLPEYETHKRALTQGSAAHKSNLYNALLVIQQAELAIANSINPHEKDEKELTTFSSGYKSR